ncbi:NAD(P)-dependent oxidoreductase [Deinococcus deserti]|uniref:Putative D-isomer specific 2-hydroxyacid dehydrogenase putative phosphoglycerate dehydrogenase-like dehydrogenase n=1 Tax=Deinococcus deserti (strain DSM 17065 / CIP 109153 / LMG 22923 / VCD115) TaxID=546414 RepID=C1CVI9_DEIDV|nr:NAD(P)-dependent oxidoreductase [Deinococcus deserti]ACO46206.1 putative D-isomer specific 2-hydroxyacid dehydrogenase; putative phosphoglycerate dehydrogenase-like dehydrogenase [Deinococcus deserti VCD115]
MRVLLPDLPEFRDLAHPDEHGVPGVTFSHYTRTEVPDGSADGAVLWMANAETRRKLIQAQGLKWVLTLTAGIDHVRNELPEGVQLYNASRLHDRAVAVHVVAGMLSAMRGLHRFRGAQGRGQWTAPGSPAASGLETLDGRNVVLWGYGHIGRHVEDFLRPFGAQVHGIRSSTPDHERDRLLRSADWVVLLLPSTPETRGIVSAEVLGLLPPGAWISNQGRGNLIVTDDLLAALQSGALGGAVLDVTDPEPLPEGHPLWAQENVILTPHIASTTTDLVHRGAMLTRDFLLDLLQDVEPPGLVDLSRSY